jgi:ABC-2 type transport system permease protein
VTGIRTGIRFLIVAKKEFADHITSRRFLTFLVIFLLFFGFSLYQGVTTYMEGYRGYIGGLEEKRPSFIQMFGIFASSSVSFLGGIFGILMGFDLIAREKESGTLRTLLSHPVFRDEVINGKAIGGFAALTLVVVLTIFVSLGILIAAGFVPTLDDFVQIIKFSLVTLAYFFTFFAIGLFASAVSKNTTTALLVAFGIFILIAVVLPIFSFVIADALAGKPPQPPPMEIEVTPGIGETSIKEDPRWEEYEKQMEEYMNKRMTIMSFLNLLSPTSNYMALVMSLSENSFNPFGTKDLTKNWIGFIATPVIFLAVSYIRFLREELA